MYESFHTVRSHLLYNIAAKNTSVKYAAAPCIWWMVSWWMFFQLQPTCAHMHANYHHLPQIIRCWKIVSDFSLLPSNRMAFMIDYLVPSHWHSQVLCRETHGQKTFDAFTFLLQMHWLVRTVLFNAGQLLPLFYSSIHWVGVKSPCWFLLFFSAIYHKPPPHTDHLLLTKKVCVCRRVDMCEEVGKENWRQGTVHTVGQKSI